ncbi:hypothetical protein FRC04_003444 [Tulasnella sp. 424]|nr:hypothetical protein FRC04_003444 [Tulasnella sp. 424]KAG8965763.1 hypothetical protein FRC05_003022 [Tulasnella sp. 425]
MTHINDLPPELLSTIFSIIIGLSKEDLPALTRRRSHQLLDILLVCRYWSSAACATPSLWTTVFVTYGSSAVQRVERYLERSGDLPLDVVITSMIGDGQVQNTEDALHVLGGHSARWRSFATSFTTPKLNGILGIIFPNLSTFSYCPALPITEFTPTITLDAPKLETLITLADMVLFKNDSWPNLKRLYIKSLRGSEGWLWTVLGASQSSLEFMELRSETMLWIRKGKFEADNGDGSAVSYLPKLRCLEVRGLSDVQFGSLRFAVMPSLTHLTLDCNFLPSSQASQLHLPTFDSLQFLHFCTDANRNGANMLSPLLERAPNVTLLMITHKVHTFISRGENMITPLLLTTAASPREALVGNKLEEVHLLRFSASVENLKKLVELRIRAGRLKKIVITKGWNVVQPRPNPNPEQDLAWVKSRVTLEEVEG